MCSQVRRWAAARFGAQRAASRAAPSSSERVATGSSAPTVAIVARDTLTRALYARALRAAGYAPLIVASYEALLEMAELRASVAVVDAPLDPLLMDVVAPPVPVVLVTSAQDPPTVDWCRAVARPFTMAELLDAILALIPAEPPDGQRSVP